MSDTPVDKPSDVLPFQCDAWSRRVHKCTSQCDGCFRREHEPRLHRAEKLLREFITTCELHKVDSKKFFDLWTDAEAARVYFKEETPRSAGGSIMVTDRQGDFATGQDRIFPDSAAITKQFRVQYAEKNGLTDECYPYSLKDGDVIDAKGRCVTIAGNRGIRDMLNEIAELRAAVAQRATRSATEEIMEYPKVMVRNDVVWLETQEHELVNLEHLARGSVSDKTRRAVVIACEKAKAARVKATDATTDRRVTDAD